MPTQKVNPENVDRKLFETFRKLGYDGTSMEILAQATGLKKASLYHRFPKGKKEMALHVLNIVEHWIDENIFSVSSNNKIKPEIRLKKMITAIDELYNGGTNNCLLRTLSIGTDADAFKDSVHRCFNLLADGFATVSIDLGNSPAVAKEKGENLNLLLQGSLVMAGATGDVSYFKNLLSKLPSLLAK
jgi:TetR/AcrR family transcriptional repressor of lmrAB and yxaGH operons